MELNSEFLSEVLGVEVNSIEKPYIDGDNFYY